VAGEERERGRLAASRAEFAVAPAHSCPSARIGSVLGAGRNAPSATAFELT
jgi:hypothetical protein